MPASPRTRRLVWLIGLVAGAGAAATGASPVGIDGVDQVLVIAASALAVWAASTAPWWMFVAVGTLAAVASATWWGVLTCAAVVAVALARRFVADLRLGRWALALQAAVLVQVVARLGDRGPVWLSAAIAIVSLSALGISGVRRRRSSTRRVVIWSAVAVAGYVVLAAGAMAAAGWSVRHDLQDGLNAARNAADHLEASDYSAASAEFERAGEYLTRADGRLNSWLTVPARLVPVLAQHRDGAVDLVSAGSAVAGQISTVTDVVGENTYEIVDGRVDLDAFRALNTPLADLSVSITALREVMENTRSPWLYPEIGERLDDELPEVVRQADLLETAAEAIAAAPAMLGADGPRSYFIGFTTPAESRGLGGFMGNFAEITVDQGDLSLTEFGRTSDLRDGGSDPRTLRVVTQEFADTYADFLFRDLAERQVWPEAWSNITVSPHFPAGAAAIAELYPQSGGRDLDGVFMMDVFALAEVMKMTGPVTIDEVGVTVSGDDAVSFLLFDQYLFEDTTERIDLLEVLARTTIDRVFAGALPPPTDLVDRLRPNVEQRNLMGWAADPTEQALFERMGVDGGLPALGDGDALHIGFFNASPSKIDTFLVSEAEYRVDTSGDQTVSTLTLSAHNTAPPEGLPEYLIGNGLELPPGTNRSYVTVHSAYPLTGLLIDGSPASWGSNAELGYTTSSFFIELAAGQRTTITATMVGPLPADDYRLDLTTPAMTSPFPVSVLVDGVLVGGDPVERPGRVTLTAERG